MMRTRSFLGLRDQKIAAIEAVKILLESSQEARNFSISKKVDDDQVGDVIVNTVTNNFVLKSSNDKQEQINEEDESQESEIGEELILNKVSNGTYNIFKFYRKIDYINP